MVLFFSFCLTVSVPKNLKSSISEMQIIPQTININNFGGTAIENSIKLHTIRKLLG